MKSVLDDRSVEGMRWRGEVVVRGRDGDQAAIEAKATAQPAGASSSIREAGCVATRSRTSLKYRKGSIPGKRPTEYVLDDRATGGVTEIREIWRGCAAFAGRDGSQADVGAKAAAQPVGVSSSIREAGCVATRSRTSLKYRKGSTPASLHPCARV